MEKKTDKGKGLIKRSLIYSIGNIGTLLLNFFLVPLYTFYLTRDELGYFDVFSSSLVVLAPVFFCHIELSALRWIIGNKEKGNITKVISHTLFVFFLGVITFSLIYFITYIFYHWNLAFFVYIYFLGNFCYIIGKQLIRAIYSPLHYVGTELLFTMVVLITILILVKSEGLKAIFMSYGLAALVLLAYMVILGIHKKIDVKSWNRSFLKELISYSLPLVPNTFNLWLNNMSNKYLIAVQLGLASNGIYAIAFKFAYVLQILNRIFYFSFQDEMFRTYGTEGFKQYFSQTVKKYLKVLFSFLFLLVGSQRIVLPYVIDTSFYQAMNYIPILGLGVLFMAMASIFGVIYQCEKNNLHAFKTSLIPGLFIVIAGIFVVPSFGLMGASVVFTVGNFMFFLYRYIDTKKYIEHEASPILIFFYTILLLGIWQISEVSGILYLTLALLLAIGLTFLLNWSLIKTSGADFLRKIKRIH